MKKLVVSGILLVSAGVLASAGFELILDDEVLKTVENQYGTAGRERVAGWGDLVKRDRLLDQAQIAEKLQNANAWFNQVRWLSDMEHWGVEDYWATPIETLASDGGDCEDFSIGKYFSLLATDVDNDSLRITYVKSLTYNQAHMVLAWYPEPDAEPLILDNIDKSIKPASERQDLIPVYSFSGDSIWLARARGKKLNANSQSSLPSWKQVNERLRSQLAQPESSPPKPKDAP